MISVQELKEKYPIYPKIKVEENGGVETYSTIVRKRNPNEGDKYYLNLIKTSDEFSLISGCILFLGQGTFHEKTSQAYLSGIPLYEDDNQED